MKQKVLFIATVLRGHLLVFHLPFMQWFQEQGYEVHCCAGNDTGSETVNVPYCDRYIEMDFDRDPLQGQNKTLQKKLKKTISHYKRLKALIEQEEYALIHCHTPMGGALGRFAARKAREKGTRVCYTAHGFHFFSGAPLKNWLLFYPVERYLSRFTDLLITINHEDYARAQRFKASETVLVHGVGVNLEQVSPHGDKAGLYAELGIDGDPPMIITVGEHSKRKNHAVCIQALERIHDAVLVFCGVGQQENGLKKLAETCHVSDRVQFLGFRKDVPRLLSAADVFVFPSLHEGLPKSLMEAMAAGLPCVVSDVRGNSDLIRDGEGGFLYKHGDIDGFVDGLQTLLDHPKLRKQFGDSNQMVIQQFGLPDILKQMAVLYTAQLSKRGDD